MLTIRKMSAYYGESRVIQSLDLDVPDNRIVCLIGRNGVGKSTTLKSIMGLVKTPEGSITLDGAEIIRLPSYDRVRLGIGYVTQGRDIFPQMTVQENLELGLKAKGSREIVPDYIYDLFPILPTFAKRNGGDLSGGQQQRVAIARALASDAKVILADEPTGNLDEDTAAEIANILKECAHQMNKCVVIVTHSNELAKQADEVLQLNRGEMKMLDRLNQSGRKGK